MSMRMLSGAMAIVLALSAAGVSLPAAAAVAQGKAPADARAPRTTPAMEVFRAVDTNKDGVLSPQEFEAGYAVVQRLAALEIRLREQFRRVDTDHNGAIDAKEYANLALVRRAGAGAPPLVAFDADKNGSLDFAEYLAAIHRLAALRPASEPPPAKK